MKTTVYVRCDAGTLLGMGHLVRCLSLSHMLRRYFNVQFILQETESTAYEWILSNDFSYLTIPASIDFETDCKQVIQLLYQHGKPGDVVVLDGYNFKTSYQESIRNAGFKVAAIDDLHQWHHSADLVLNHAPGITNQQYDTAPYTRLLLGSSYALLRSEILRAAQTHRQIKNVDSYLISMGAADTDNCTLQFAALIRESYPNARIHLLVSTLNPHLKELEVYQRAHAEKVSIHSNLNTEELIQLILKTDVVFCPASTISLEACALGCSIISGYTAENQLGILEGLTAGGAAISLGHFQTLDIDSARQKIDSFVSNLSLRVMQRDNQRRLIDGNSGLRVALAMLEMTSNMTYRNARAADAWLLFNWTNDPSVRANSFQSEPIPWENHVKWYEQTLGSPLVILLIYQINGIDAAQIRLNREERIATISFSVDAAFRGKGLGTRLLEHICIKAKLEYPEIAVLQGWVKKTNTASLGAFSRSGFLVAEEYEDRILFKLKLDSL